NSARLEHGNAALELPVQLHVLELDHVVGRERDTVAGEMAGAEQLCDIHVQVERDTLGAKVLGHGVHQLLEAPFGGYAELHAGEAVEHGALGPDLFDQLPRPIEEGVGRELDGRNVVKGEEPALLDLAEVPSEAL